MNVLLLSPHPESLIQTLNRSGDRYRVLEDPLTPDRIPYADMIVSYGYQYIIREPFLSAFKGRVINIHISLLPWNRGADPNFWSWYEDTPKGVTIHEIDEKIDTGPILVQRKAVFYPEDTLRTSYERLKCFAEVLFDKTWPIIRDGEISAIPQCSAGTYHKTKDKEPIWAMLPDGYDTPVRRVTEIRKQKEKACPN